MIRKACPVVIQDRACLMFRHPLAGVQVVKGTIENGERPEAAAIREMREEAGVTGIRAPGPVTQNAAIDDGQIWFFVPLAAERMPKSWTHHCADDGGHDFTFFWQPIEAPTPPDCHPVFARALAHIKLTEGTR